MSPKVIFLDVGLYNYLCNLQWRVIFEMDQKRLVNEGYIAEQFIGQNLRYAAGLGYMKELYYWLREGKTANAEIDFLINTGTHSGAKCPYETHIDLMPILARKSSGFSNPGNLTNLCLPLRARRRISWQPRQA